DDVTVFGNPNANLANIFPYVVSRGRTVYAAATGISGTRGAGKAPDNHYGVYLFRSRDRGRHWSKPIAVDRHGLKANALASLTVGPVRLSPEGRLLQPLSARPARFGGSR